MNYGENISGAFRISLRNPFLWFFGLFVGGSGFTVTLSGQNEGFGPSPDLARFVENNLAALIIGGIIFAVALTVVFIALIIISQAGLVAGVAELREGESNGFSSTWRAGLRNFWRMLGLYISLFLINFLLFFLAVIPAGLAVLLAATALDSVGLAVALVALAALLTLVLLILLLVPFSIVSALAMRTLVLDGRGVFDSIGEGFTVFRNNIGRGLLVWLIQVGLAIAVGLLLSGITFAIGLLASSLLSPLLEGFSMIDLLISGGVLLLFSLPFLLLGAIVGTFMHAYWTIAYLQFRPESSIQSSAESG